MADKSVAEALIFVEARHKPDPPFTGEATIDISPTIKRY
jgi:hypothetical protein